MLLSIREYLASDFPTVEELDKQSDRSIGSTHLSFLIASSPSQSTRLICEVGGNFAGFMKYTNQEKTIFLEYISVVKEWKRCGVGGWMIDHLILMAGDKKITCIPNEMDFGTISFFKNRGFICVNTIKKMFDEEYDGYVMEYGKRSEFSPKNRFANWTGNSK